MHSCSRSVAAVVLSALVMPLAAKAEGLVGVGAAVTHPFASAEVERQAPVIR